MTESTCPACAGEVSGVGSTGRRRRKTAAPDTSTGYCMACHIGLTKARGAWRRSPA